MAPEPLAHFYAAPDVSRPEHDHDRFPAGRCARADCRRPESDPVHLTPGDEPAILAAIQATGTGRTARDPDRAIERAEQRNRGRYTYGTGNRCHGDVHYFGTGDTCDCGASASARGTSPSG